MNYKVGQVLYLCNEEKMKIIPLRVVEEIIRTTIEGKEKSYILIFPDSKRTKVNLKSIKGKVFDNIEQIKNHMIKNATDAINRMAITAEELQTMAFPRDQVETEVEKVHQINNDVQVENKDDIITVDLGGGVKAKMNTNSLEKVANQWKYYF